jgi:4-hydroxy-3-methylbut-2-enyl diphosphate reductase
MKIVKATYLGMCFGVRDAISLALEESKKESISILGDLVHNETVNEALRKNGIKIKHGIDEVDTQTVMITAHGASEIMVKQAIARGHHVLEATCPLVRFAHQSVMDLAKKGYHPVIIGKRGHVEVNGLTGDLVEYDIILNEEDVMHLKERSRFGIASQTTQPIDRVRYLVSLIRERFPRSEIQFKDTVCQPTKQRQTAAENLAKECEVVLVIGGLQSNNTRELVTTCSQFCSRVHHIQSSKDLKPFWFYNAETVGITAGTSTPDEIIEAVEKSLMEFQKK